MREPVVDGVSGQSTGDDLVNGLIDDCASHLEKNNLWDANASSSSIKQLSEIYNIASQEGDDDDDDSLSFDRLLGHARLEKSPMESWISTINSSDVEPNAGINILANASMLRPLIPAAMVPASLLGSINSGLPQDQTLIPMARPNEQVAMIPVIEHSAAKLSFALAHAELPSGHAPSTLVSQSPALTAPSSQTSIPQNWAQVGGGEPNRTYPSKTQVKPSRSRANRPKMEVSKPAMNEKESHELERVMDILKRYKQQLAEGDPIGQFLPCKRKRSKPPSQMTEASSSYSKPSELETTSEHEKTTMLDIASSKSLEKMSMSHAPMNVSYCFESKSESDLASNNSTTGIFSTDNVDCRVHVRNPVVYPSVPAGNDAIASFSPGTSYAITTPMSMLQCSPNATDPATSTQCIPSGIGYQLETSQGMTRYQVALPPAGFNSNIVQDTTPEPSLVALSAKAELERCSMSQLFGIQRNTPNVVYTQEQQVEEPSSTLSVVCKEDDNGEERVNALPAKLTVEEIRQNLAEPIPACRCLASFDESFDESKEGPYYTQLGAAESISKIREIMERRFEITGAALRIEKVVYTGKEGKNPNGCPVAKWIIRRSSEEEKVLVLVRRRLNHSCNSAVLVIGIVVWDGIADSQKSDSLYDYLTQVLSVHGLNTDRRCGSNDQKVCRCQGWDDATGGASFTFGCSWSMFYNGCKFAKSSVPRKFRLKKQQEEERLEKCLNQLASDLSPLYAKAAPDSFRNQTQAGNDAADCRLGYTSQRPWSGVTGVVDYCTHSHKDLNNMHNGCVAVVSLTKHRSLREKPEDEQLHVLPLYVLDSTDEFDSPDGQCLKVLSGAVECLTKFPSVMRIQQQKTSGQPRRNYRNKPKHRGNPTEKLPKKVGRLTHKRSRPSNLRTTKVVPQKLQEVSGGVSGGTEATSCKGEQTVMKEAFNVGDGAKPASDVNISHEIMAGETVSSNHIPALDSQSLTRPDQLLDVMTSLSAWPGNNSVSSSLVPRHDAGDSLHMFWNLENSDDTRMEIGGTREWMNAINESCGLKNSDRSIPDNNLLIGSSTTEINSSQASLGVDQQSTVAHEEPTTSAEAIILGDHDMSGTDEVVSLAASSDFGAQKCGGFLQLLNGDEDVNYSDGCLTSSEFYHQYLHRKGTSDEEDRDYAEQSDDFKIPEKFGDVSESKNKPECAPGSRKELLTDNEHVFKDRNVGGVAIALTHGSVFFEVAKREVHATTAVKNPNRFAPTRIALIFYQHKHLNLPCHGNRQPGKVAIPHEKQTFVEKEGKPSEDNIEQPSQICDLSEASFYEPSSSQDDKPQTLVENQNSVVGGCTWTAPVNNVHTLTTTTMVTKWIQPKLATSGPYQCWG